jgi:undecaprenyl pyrophosphate phosphatase UppP
MEKSSLSFRWVMLSFACIMMVGLYYSSDIPAALKPQLERYMDDKQNNEFNFGLLFSLYAIPNVSL